VFQGVLGIGLYLTGVSWVSSNSLGIICIRRWQSYTEWSKNSLLFLLFCLEFLLKMYQTRRIYSKYGVATLTVSMSNHHVGIVFFWCMIYCTYVHDVKMCTSCISYMHMHINNQISIHQSTWIIIPSSLYISGKNML